MSDSLDISLVDDMELPSIVGLANSEETELSFCKNFPDTILEDNDNDNDLNDSLESSNAEAVVQKNRFNLYRSNVMALLISIVRLRLKDNNTTDSKITEYLDKIELYSYDSELNKILDNYMSPKIPNISLLISPKATLIALLQTFQKNLFPSLVGSLNIPYSQSTFNEAVDWLDEVGSRYALEQAKLSEKMAEKNRMAHLLFDLTHQCLEAEPLLQHATLSTKERVAKLKVQKTEMKLLEKESRAKQTETSNKNPKTYTDIVLENAALEKRLAKLMDIKTKVARLDQYKVNRLRQLYQELRFANSMAINTTRGSKNISFSYDEDFDSPT